MAPAKTLVAAAVVALVAALSACSGSSVDDTPAAPLTSSSTATATDTPSTTPTTSAADAALQAASASLTTKLYALSAAQAAVKSRNNLADGRKLAGEGVNAAREDLKRARSAAYGSVRNCSLVRTYAGRAHSASLTAAAGRNKVYATSASLNGALHTLALRRAAVATGLSALESALKSTTAPPGGLTVDQVKAALGLADALRSSTISSISTARGAASNAASNAASASSNASSVTAKAC